MSDPLPSSAMRAVTLTDVAHRPAPGTVAPTAIRFLPNGATALALLAPPESLEQSLVAIDCTTAATRPIATPGQRVEEAELSLAERLRRERARQLTVGVTSFQVAPLSGQVLVPMSDGLWLFDHVDGDARLVVAEADVPGGIDDPRICDDGSAIGFVSDDEVYVVATAPGATPVAVTAGARDRGVTHGLAEYIAQEEMDRSAGYWLCGDASRVAFCEVDEGHIPRYPIVHLGSDEVGEGTVDEHAYPFAGAANATVRVGVVAVSGESDAPAPVWLDLDATGIGDDRYVARVQWAPNGEVWVQVSDRAQQRLEVIAFDPDTGQGRPILTETSDLWINLHHHLRFVGDEFLWASERSGFRHLEVWGVDGTRHRTLTSGDWVVTSVDAVADATVWFTSTIASPLDRNLCRVPLAGGDVEIVDDSPGVHRSVVHGPTGTVIDTHHTLTQPPRTSLRTVSPDGDTPSGDTPSGDTPSGDTPSGDTPSGDTPSGGTPSGGPASGTVLRVHDGDTDDVAELALDAPELIEIAAADGSTTLHGAVFAPTADGPHPLIVWVYGGPHVQLVSRSWALTANMRAQFLRQAGYCVALVDGRGSWDRGLAFEGALHRRMGSVEVDDQVALVEHLVASGVADPDRVGIYGWSYGGYMSAMALARRPDVFAAGCAGAPVTSWDGYDTHYTERYMSTPADNPEGYADGSVMTHVEGIDGRSLMLIHGLIDENVHFRHTARLVSALNRADIGYELLVYPDERHSPRREADRASMERRIVDFFDRSLRS